MDGNEPIPRQDPCELLKQFCKLHISLFCLEINEDNTKKMYDEFKDIYDDVKINNFKCRFDKENNKNKNTPINIIKTIYEYVIEVYNRDR